MSWIGVPLEMRLWSKVQIGSDDECWPWMGTRNQKGYGRIYRGGKRGQLTSTHIAAWELANGPLPKGMCVCHTCDCPPCCNQAHLFVGTHKDNAQDKVSKGRHRYGQAYSDKLCDDDVLNIYELRAAGFTYPEIGAAFGIAASTVSSIVHGKMWSHLHPSVVASSSLDPK